jgi:hypothetical protein
MDKFIVLFDLIMKADKKEIKRLMKIVDEMKKNKLLSVDDHKHLKKLGNGLYQDIANVYRRNACDGKARDLLDGELHPLCNNFLGPGTRIDLPEVLNYPPYSKVDNCARDHDIAYLEAWDKPKKEKENLIKKADDIFLDCIENVKNDDYPSYLLGKAGIKTRRLIEENTPINLGFTGGCKKCKKGGCMSCGGKKCLNKCKNINITY